MKVIWEAKDIRGGLRVVKRGVYTDRECLISYMYVDHANGDTSTHWAAISMTDGNILCPYDKAEYVADWLTQNQYLPKPIQ